MTVAGTWNLTIATPIGRQAVVLELSERDGRRALYRGVRRHDGALRGSARGTAEEVPLIDLVRDGNRLTWRQAITRPLRLNLAFDVTVEGDTLTGLSRAGRLPSSSVTGTRVRP
jgi:hypothetical protein